MPTKPIPKELVALATLFTIAALAGLAIWLGTAAFLIFTFVWALTQILTGHGSVGAGILVVLIPGLAALITLAAHRAHRAHRKHH